MSLAEHHQDLPSSPSAPTRTGDGLEDLLFLPLRRTHSLTHSFPPLTSSPLRRRPSSYRSASGLLFSLFCSVRCGVCRCRGPFPSLPSLLTVCRVSCVSVVGGPPPPSTESLSLPRSCPWVPSQRGAKGRLIGTCTVPQECGVHPRKEGRKEGRSTEDIRERVTFIRRVCTV